MSGSACGCRARRIKGEYATLVPVAIRECQVSFSDGKGVHHRVTVQASSVLEAAGLGLKRVREQEMLDSDDGFGEIKVEILYDNHSHGSNL